jgi:serine/threonine protein phosphatase 1
MDFLLVKTHKDFFQKKQHENCSVCYCFCNFVFVLFLKKSLQEVRITMNLLSPDLVDTHYTFPVPTTNPNGRRFAISDIHGCAKTFIALIDKIALTTNDQLFLLGDYINKGPDSKGVLDCIMTLQEQGYPIFTLRGNHEEVLLYAQKRYLQTGYLPKTLAQRRNKGLEDSQRHLLPQYQEFLEKMPYYFELDGFLLVHAGFNFQSESPFTDIQKMLWTRYFEVDKKLVGEKKIIHGHVPEYIQFIQDDILYESQNICIDNGCLYHNRKNAGLGNLIALNLDTMQLTVQENIEFRKQHLIFS